METTITLRSKEVLQAKPVTLPFYCKAPAQYMTGAVEYYRIHAAGDHPRATVILINGDYVAFYPTHSVPSIPEDHTEIDRAEFMSVMDKVFDGAEAVVTAIMSECGTPAQV